MSNIQVPDPYYIFSDAHCEGGGPSNIYQELVLVSSAAWLKLSKSSYY